MARQIAIKSIPVADIEIGTRRRQPSEEEIELRAKSINEYGLLEPIGVRTNGDKFCLVYGATRLMAVKKLGWGEINAAIFEGAMEEFASMEITENLERRHLNKCQRDELTIALVELRISEAQNDPRNKLNDKVSSNSSQQPASHPKNKVEGSKRGRPITPEGKAKREAAEKTGQSLRTVQRATSEKPAGGRGPKNKTSANRDIADLGHMDQIAHYVLEIGKHLAACDRNVCEMIRKNHKSYLEGWFGSDGKLLSQAAEYAVVAAKIAPVSAPHVDEANHEHQGSTVT